jgi:hypothetical protein
MDSEDFRRARAYAAWILLVAAAVEVAMGAWALSGLPGGPFSGNPLGSAISFGLRGEAAAPNLLQFTVTALPVAAVLLAAMGGRPVGTTRQITVTAVTIQTLALLLGMVACVAAFGANSRWANISLAAEIAVAAAGLILTSAVLRSRGADPLRRPRAGMGNR